MEECVAYGPRVNWVAKARWVRDGNIWTSSGVTAGIDATLAWVEAEYVKHRRLYLQISWSLRGLNRHRMILFQLFTNARMFPRSFDVMH